MSGTQGGPTTPGAACLPFFGKPRKYSDSQGGTQGGPTTPDAVFTVRAAPGVVGPP